jgi:hypothetical protein
MGQGDGMGLERTGRPALRLVLSRPDDATAAGPHHPPAPRRRTTPVGQTRAPGTTGDWRLLRGGVVGTAATVLAVGGHCLSSGRPPTWPTMLCWAVLLASASTWLSRVRWTMPPLLAVLLVGQVGMHATFVATQPPLPAAGAHMHAHPAAHTETLLPSSLSMVAGHVAAAVMTAALLRWGERWLCGVLDALALRIHRLLDAFVIVLDPRAHPVPVAVDDPPRLRVVTAAWSPRGPPC